MSLLKKASQLRLMVVIDKLQKDELVKLGQHFRTLPVPPKVTLVKTVPIHGARGPELIKAREALTVTNQALKFPASQQIAHGTNPSVLTNLLRGPTDAMVVGRHHNTPVLLVKNLIAGIEKLMDIMDVKDLSHIKAHKEPASKKPKANFEDSKAIYQRLLSKPKFISVEKPLQNKPEEMEEHGFGLKGLKMGS